MAYIQPRKNKNGEIISYTIRVYRDRDKNGVQLKPYTATFKVDKTKTAKQNEKALKEFVVDYERKCKEGIACDNRLTFAEYVEYVLRTKETAGLKTATLENYRSLLPRINEAIGHIKLSDISPMHLNNFYEHLLKHEKNHIPAQAVAKTDIKKIIYDKGLTVKKVAEIAGIASNTVSIACNKTKPIQANNAEAISKALGYETKKLFNVKSNDKPLSTKTVLEHHRFISTVLDQAEKELLIPYNPAKRASKPKLKRKQAKYFQSDEVIRILDCLKDEPIKWRTLIELLIVTGARRGEIVGLKWNCIDWKNNRIHISGSILSSKEKGVYEETTKTEKSDRFVSIPIETMELLKGYKKWYQDERAKYGSQWNDTGYLFFQEKLSKVGKPIHPESVNIFLKSFAKRHNLPHINPHAFRHTMASILIFNGNDNVSISHRLGHSQVSTTTDIYSHIIKEADLQSAETIANLLFRKKLDKDKNSDG